MGMKPDRLCRVGLLVVALLVWVLPTACNDETRKGRNEVVEPETLEPETAEPETAEPETAEPEVQEPEVQEPEMLEPAVLAPRDCEADEQGCQLCLDTGGEWAAYEGCPGQVVRTCDHTEIRSPLCDSPMTWTTCLCPETQMWNVQRGCVDDDRCIGWSELVDSTQCSEEGNRCQIRPVEGGCVAEIRSTEEEICSEPWPEGAVSAVAEMTDEICCEGQWCTTQTGEPGHCRYLPIISGPDPGYVPPTCLVHQCFVDSDCEEGSLCLPGSRFSGANRCIPSTCKTHADCNGSRCVLFDAQSCFTPPASIDYQQVCTHELRDECEGEQDCNGQPCTLRPALGIRRCEIECIPPP